MPSSFIFSMSRRRAMPVRIVRKLVRVPPSQRLVTKCIPARAASSWTISCAWRLVPTNSTWPPLPTTSLMKL